MGKLNIFIASFVMLFTSNAAQSAQSVKKYTPMELLVSSCEALHKSWSLDNKTRDTTLTHNQQVEALKCYNILTTTITVVQLASDSVELNKLCIPEEAPYKEILSKTLPQLKIVNDNQNGEILDPALGMVVALKFAYTCKK